MAVSPTLFGLSGFAFPLAECDYPSPADVRSGTEYGGGAYTGTLAVPTSAPTGGTVIPSGRYADLVHQAVRSRLDDALPDAWTVYARRDMNRLPADVYPCVYVVPLVEQILEEESDNQVLVGYPFAVVLMVQEAVVRRTDPALVGLRRQAQRAVYTTHWPALDSAGLMVEQSLVSEGVPISLPDLADGITATGFTVTVGVLENRETL